MIPGFEIRERSILDRDDDIEDSDRDSVSTNDTSKSKKSAASNVRTQPQQPVAMIEPVIVEMIKPKPEDKQIKMNYPPTQVELLEDKRFPSSSSKFVCTKFDPEDKYVAAACDDGILRVYDVNKITLFNQFPIGEGGESLLTLKWRPLSNTAKTKNVLICTDAAGNLFHLHVTTNQILHKIHEPENQIYGVDYNFDATQFATAGLDCTVRVYDENKKSVSIELKDSEKATGHNNRILGVKYAGQSPNILLTGGWDKTIQIWDTRTKEAVASIYGPEIAGDSIDFRDNVILTGSWRNFEQLQLWDFGTRRKIATIPWDWDKEVIKNTYVYSCQFSKSSDNQILAASTGVDEIRIFDKKANYAVKAAFNNSNKGVFSADFSSDDSKFTYGGTDGTFGVYEFKKPSPI
jgi:WD40 repeat protein